MKVRAPQFSGDSGSNDLVQDIWRMWLVAGAFVAVHSFSTFQAIVRILLRGEEWSGGDFTAFYATAKASYELGITPYFGGLVQQATGILSAFTSTYPPFTLLLFVPYICVDITTAFVIHTFVSMFAAGVYFFYLQKLFLNQIVGRYIAWIVVGLVFWSSIPSVENFLRGQTNFIIGALILFSWDQLRQNSRGRAVGLALGLATLIKVYFAALLIPLVFLRRFSVITSAAVIGILALVLSIVFFPKAGWIDWFDVVLPAGGLGKDVPDAAFAASRVNHSLNGLLSRSLGNSSLLRTLGYPIVAAVWIGTAIALWRARRMEWQLAVDSCIPLMQVAIFLVSPLSWPANYIFLWLAILGSMKVRAQIHTLTPPFLAIHLFLLFLFSLPWSGFTFGKYESVIAAPPTMAAFLLWGLCLQTVEQVNQRFQTTDR